MGHLIDPHFGRSKEPLASPVTALQDLNDLNDGVVTLGRIVALGNGLMPAWVERLADALLGLEQPYAVGGWLRYGVFTPAEAASEPRVFPGAAGNTLVAGEPVKAYRVIMRTVSAQEPGCVDEALGWSSRTTGFVRVPGVMVLLVLLHDPVRVLSESPSGTSSVTLAWDSSPTTEEVTGYRVYYGAASGNYSNSVEVGNVTTNTVQGLTNGVTYFFAVTAYNASGLESDFSNEVSYTVAGELPTIEIRIAPARQVVLTVTGLVGHTYYIQATHDLKIWTVIGSVIVGAGGSFGLSDTNAADVPERFYRILDALP